MAPPWLSGRQAIREIRAPSADTHAESPPPVRWVFVVVGVVVLLISLYAAVQWRSLGLEFAGQTVNTGNPASAADVSAFQSLLYVELVALVLGAIDLFVAVFPRGSRVAHRAWRARRRVAGARAGPPPSLLRVLSATALVVVAALAVVALSPASAPTVRVETFVVQTSPPAGPPCSSNETAYAWSGVIPANTVVVFNWTSLSGTSLDLATFTDLSSGTGPGQPNEGDTSPAGLAGWGSLEAAGHTYGFSASWFGPTCSAHVPVLLTLTLFSGYTSRV